MTSVRRARYLFFVLEDDIVVDAATILTGHARADAVESRVVALVVSTGEREELTREELEVLLAVPVARWVDAGAHDQAIVRALVLKGLLLSDPADEHSFSLRERDETLEATEWNTLGALYHYMTRWSGVDLVGTGDDETALFERAAAAAEAFVAEHGKPPSPFSEEGSRPQLSLPGVERDHDLYRTLAARQTTRAFDASAPMALEHLDTVLGYVFGCRGYARTAGDTVCIKRTSPSGGGLHSIEAYPIVMNVAGVPPGTYHYNDRDHALGLISELEPADGHRMATAFMAGQSYFGSAHVLIVLTARFYRSYWKYRRHPKAYAAVLMDAAHLSQTLYLVSADLGLGAFITIAINGRDIEAHLGLDGVNEGVIAVLGCGPRAATRSPLELEFSPEPPPGSLHPSGGT